MLGAVEHGIIKQIHLLNLSITDIINPLQLLNTLNARYLNLLFLIDFLSVSHSFLLMIEKKFAKVIFHRNS